MALIPFAHPHDSEFAGLRDFYEDGALPRRRRSRALAWIVALIVFALAFTALAFAQDGGELPTGQPVSSIGRIYPLVKGTAGKNEDGFHQVALKDLATTVWTHACTSGVVAFKAREADGDIHIRLTDSAGHYVVAEVIPRLPVPPPKTGQHVQICGITRIDRKHRTKEYSNGWPELHPVLSIRLLAKGTS